MPIGLCILISCCSPSYCTSLPLGLVKLQEGIRHCMFCSFCLGVFLLPFPSRNLLQDAQCHLCGMLFPNKARLTSSYGIPQYQCLSSSKDPPCIPCRGSLTRLSHPDPFPLEILNYEALSQWELEARNCAIIKAHMGLCSAYVVLGLVLRPLPSFTLFQAHSSPTRWYHCVSIIQTRKLVHKEVDTPPHHHTTEAAPVHESRVLLWATMPHCLLHSRRARIGLTSW